MRFSFKKPKAPKAMSYEELVAESKKPAMTQAELSKRWYEKKKAEAEALGIPITKYLNRKPRSYDPEQRKAQYLKQKAEGKIKNYYKEAKAKDPLYNQKAHIRRKTRNINWQTVKGDRANHFNWVTIIEHIRESDLPTDELAREISKDWRILRHTANRRSEASKTIYRPRITNRVLTDEQIEELDNYAIKSGLTSQHEVVKSTVSYYGELKDIDSREEEKEVDVYTVQEKGKDYSKDDDNRRTPAGHIINNRAVFYKKLIAKRNQA